jgi:hypothetical protein
MAACVVARHDAACGDYPACFETLRKAYSVLPAPEPLVPRVALGVVHAVRHTRARLPHSFTLAVPALGRLPDMPERDGC